MTFLPTLHLTERLSTVARLAPADVQHLLAHHPTHLHLTPTGRRHEYRLLARGVVGVIAGPTCRLVIAPKIPLRNLLFLLDPAEPPTARPDRQEAAPLPGVLDFLAGQLARHLRERARAGLHRAYVEKAEHGSPLQGRLDLPAQLREGGGRKDRLHFRYEELTADMPCNRVPCAVAERLLRLPLLDQTATALREALHGYEGVGPQPLDVAEVRRLAAEPGPEDYRPLLELCRLLAEGLAPAEPSGAVPAPSFLLEMERVFERYLTRGVVEAFAGSRWAVGVQEDEVINQPAAGQPALTVRPDLTIREDGRPLLVVDAKWKRLRDGLPATADLYQMLAYCAALGVGQAVLVYPGRRDARWTYTLRKGPLVVEARTLRVTDSPARCRRSLAWLGNALRDDLGR
jgi:5-methylcytosine-specific restriction enzyme subunit McrC